MRSDAEILDFRIRWGLRHDSDYIETVESHGGQAENEYLVPLTDDELANLATRRSTQDALEPLVDVLAQDESVAGYFLDQEAGGVFHITTTMDPSALRSMIDPLIPEGADVVVESVANGKAELQAVRDNIASDVLALRQEGTPVVSVGVDSATNSVLVGLDPYTTDASELIRERYGVMTSVLETSSVSAMACSSRYQCDNPYRGGTQIYVVSSGQCTSAFMGRHKGEESPGNWYIITAGHCILRGGGVGAFWYHNGSAVGCAVDYNFFSGMDADVGQIKVTYDTPTNYFYANGTRYLTSKKSNHAQYNGVLTCRGGQASNNWVCDEIFAADTAIIVQLQGQGYFLNHSWSLPIRSIGGDSGGPVAVVSQAFGIVSAASEEGQPPRTTYSSINYASSLSDYRPCFTTSDDPCQ